MASLMASDCIPHHVPWESAYDVLSQRSPTLT